LAQVFLVQAGHRRCLLGVFRNSIMRRRCCILLLAALHASLLTTEVEGKLAQASPNRPLVAAAWAHTRDIRHSLEEVLDLALGKGNHQITDVRLGRLREQFKTLFAALPKNNKGLLGHSTVRYAMHRHFVYHHGMYVKGLEPAGDAWNTSSPVDIMEDRVPSYVQQLFEDRLQDGFELAELALLAATLEHFIHTEAKERLQQAYSLQGLQEGVEGSISKAQLHTVIKAYMAGFISGDFSSKVSEAELQAFPSWEKSEAWLEHIEDTVTEQVMGSGHQDQIPFWVASEVVKAIIEQYGHFQNDDCKKMARTLNAQERHGTGRMTLKSFYGAGWQFSETKDFLRQLGTIDEHFRPKEGPWVVIPNYVVSLTNCLASSSMYTVCCMDPCEDILRHLESRVGAAEATPEELVHLVAATASTTVQAPRGLSANLVKHLNEIAQNHGGKVPLHGRLFAQWLHHAFPRECVFPQVSGTHQPLSAEDWMRVQNSTSASVSPEELHELLAEDEAVHVKDLADGDMEETLPWDKQEELVFHHSRPSLGHEVQVLLRGAAMVVTIYAITMGLVQAVKALSSSATGKAVI